MKQQYHIRNGFLSRPETAADFAPSRARALDGHRRPFSPDEEEPEIEIHNHVPMNTGEEPEELVVETFDEEELSGALGGEVVARYPANGYTVQTEDDEHVVYRGTPQHKSDRFEMDTARARDSRSRAPRTLAELNRLNVAHYAAKRGRR